MAGTSTSSDVPQLQIRFITKQECYAVPDYPLSVPAPITPEDLNTLLNTLLRETVNLSASISFDFLVSSEFLRSPLSTHISDRGLSTEDVILIEYLEKHPPPEPQNCLLHDDWVASVAVAEKWILTGCYDNTLHIWTAKGNHKLTIPGHTAAVKSVAWISLTDELGMFVSASQDQTAIIWQWNIHTNSVECVHVCRGHEQGLESVGVSTDAEHMATGAWDNMLKVWGTSENESDEPEKKKAKVDKGKTRVPKRTMKGHKEAISGTVWVDRNELISSSWDHTIKVWDAELGGMKHEIVGNKSFFDVDFSRIGRVLVTASADRHVRIYDPRSNEGSVVKSTLTSHTQWVQTVCWSTTDANMFLSGGYDNCLKLWDTRSPTAPLYELSGHEDKVFSCNWSNPKLMVSGGADNTVRIFKSSNTLH
ncbi:ribosome biogenesis protein WDR12 homolog [Diachasma alloeum]|uniref:ribosome biogenesis protein WDR12 homolog n=1 Tax=Diachasma alloeum TaxID=454923 RepID=UPI00073815D9|nr:ribosome biogenesis protein WDR12 homolog [Diachasma alloeum]